MPIVTGKNPRCRLALAHAALVTRLVLALVAAYVIDENTGQTAPWRGVETHAGAVGAHLGGVATHVWTIEGHFETIPVGIGANAVVDGATHRQAFRHVLLPTAVPILRAVFVLAFIGTVIEHTVASVLLREEPRLTPALGSESYLFNPKHLWGDFAAAAVRSGLPITLVFLAAQRWIVSGLAAGGVKG